MTDPQRSVEEYIRVPVVQTLSVPVVQTLYNPKRYGILPEPVLRDAAISDSAKLVYAFIAMWVFGDDHMSCGQRAIAKALGKNLSTINRALKELQGRGHITISGQGKARRAYFLTSGLFGEARSTIKECASCHQAGRKVNRANHCHRCEMQQKIALAIRELGPNATAEDVAIRLNSRQIPQIRKLIGEMSAARKTA